MDIHIVFSIIISLFNLVNIAEVKYLKLDEYNKNNFMLVQR